MKNIIQIFLIYCFSLSIISCAKRDSSSEKTIWSGTNQIGISMSEYETKVTFESSDNSFASEQINIGLDESTNSESDNIFLVKYNSSGTKRWTEQLGISDNESGTSLVVDSFDNIYVTGYSKGELDGNTNSVNFDIFLIKYNSSGIKQWTKLLGESTTNRGMGITVDSFDNIYLTGYTRILDRNINLGGEDIVLMKYNSFGTNQWTKQLGVSASEFTLDVNEDSSHNINVIGLTDSSFNEDIDHLSDDIFLVKYNSDGVLQ